MHQQFLLWCSLTDRVFLHNRPQQGMDTGGTHKGISDGREDADRGRYMDTPADETNLHLQLGTVTFTKQLANVYSWQNTLILMSV